jgi:hypothetical protein
VSRPLARFEAYLLLVWAALAAVAVVWRAREVVDHPLAAALWWAVWVAVLVAGLSVLRALRGRRHIELGPDGLRDMSRLGRCRSLPYEGIRTVSGRESDRGGILTFEIGAEGRTIRLDCWLPGWPELVAEVWRRQPSLRVALPGRLPNRIRAIRDGVAIAPATDVSGLGLFVHPFGWWRVTQSVGYCALTAMLVTVAALEDRRPAPVDVAVWCALLLLAALVVWEWRAGWARVRAEIRAEELVITDRFGREHRIPWADLVDYSVVGSQWGGGPWLVVHTRSGIVPWPVLLPGDGPLEDALIDALWKMDKELAARQS